MKKNSVIKNWDKRSEETLHKGLHEHVKRVSDLLVNREMQMKAKMIQHHPHTKMA